MSSAYFDPAVGGNGTTVTDDSNVTTGLSDGGHRTRFVPAMGQVVAVANYVVNTAASIATGASGASLSGATTLDLTSGNATLTSASDQVLIDGLITALKDNPTVTTAVKDGKNLIKIIVAGGSEKPYFKKKYGKK